MCCVCLQCVWGDASTVARERSLFLEDVVPLPNGGKRPGSASLDGAVAYKLDIGNIIISLVFVFPGTRAAP